jgi:hypothetical protein
VVPDGALAVTPTSGQIPADPLTNNDAQNARARLNPIPIVQAPTFTLELNTTPALNNVVYRSVSYTDVNTDDLAIFRFNAGYADLNANGQIDFNFQSGVSSGYERFLTVNQPAYNGTTAVNGRYTQTIDAAQLPEGYNYVSALAFRRRPAGTSPLFREWRQAIYVDRVPPEIQWTNQVSRLEVNQYRFDVRAVDSTARRVHLLVNPPTGVDPRTLVNINNLMRIDDRFTFFLTAVGLTHGPTNFTFVVFEESDTLMRSNAQTFNVFVDLCPADLNEDGIIDFNDLLEYLNLYNAQDPRADLNGDGVIDFNDLLEYLNQYNTPCP